MAWPLVQLVSAPDTTATVRLDLNPGDAAGMKVRDDFSLGSPSIRADPDSVNIEYGTRTLAFTSRVMGPKATALAKHSAIAREVLRSAGWLRWQLSSGTESVWFRTLRAQPGDLTMELVEAASSTHPDIWDIAMSIPAEPWAYGAKVTHSAATINNDPASGTNPCRIVLPTILGDAPAPLRMQVDPSFTNAGDGYRFMFSLHAGESAPAGPVVWQVGGTDGFTAGTDTSASTADATMSGGTRRTVSFATDATLVTRLSGAVAASLPLGTYKILVRVARSDTSSKFAVRLGQLVGISYFYGDTVAMDRDASTGSGHATWLDLGEFVHPRGHITPPDVTGAGFAPTIALQAQRTSGTGSLHIDAFMAIPVDVDGTLETRTLFSEFPVIGIGSSTGYGVFDGDYELVYGYNSIGFAEAGMTAELQGAFPRAFPGAANVLHFLQQVNAAKPLFGNDTADSISFSTSLIASYHPRWLWIGDG